MTIIEKPTREDALGLDSKGKHSEFARHCIVSNT